MLIHEIVKVRRSCVGHFMGPIYLYFCECGNSIIKRADTFCSDCGKKLYWQTIKEQESKEE